MSKKAGKQTGKTENFGTRNVRLITFLIVMGIFLAVAGPVSVFQIKRWIDRRETGNRTMTEEELIRLTESPEPLTFTAFRSYTGRYSKTESHQNYVIDFDHYKILIAADRKTGTLISCRLYDMDREDGGVDLLRESPRTYLNRDS